MSFGGASVVSLASSSAPNGRAQVRALPRLNLVSTLIIICELLAQHLVVVGSVPEQSLSSFEFHDADYVGGRRQNSNWTVRIGKACENELVIQNS